ncbi:MAG: hypothetical protein AAF802_31610 [Planctomycetota bacterium]
MKRRSRRSVALFAVLLVAVGWPPVYCLFVDPLIRQTLFDSHLSNEQLTKLLYASRYTIIVPADLDGHFLTFDAIVDGKTIRGGGSSVEGGSTITLLLRRNQQARKIEYCWLDHNTVARGVLDDPLSGAGTFSVKENGMISAGDWLLRGGRKGVQVYPADKPAEFELRLAFDDP